MGQNTAINWTDHTFNPWIGCTRVSPGCTNCYAESRMDHRFHVAEWGKGKPRHRTSADYWKEPLRWNKAAAEEQLTPGAIDRRRCPLVFCASLSDWLDEEVPVQWLLDLLDLIASTPYLTWQLLTKRPQNFRPNLQLAVAVKLHGPHSPGSRMAQEWLHGMPPQNVWLGTTVEDQARANERIPELINIPANIRFLSCEPLLGSLDLKLHSTCKFDHDGGGDCHIHRLGCPTTLIHWIIAGGESSDPGDPTSIARPMHPDWARSLRDQCAATGTAFLFKQWGDYREFDQGPVHGTMKPFTHASEAVLARAKNPSWITAKGKHIHHQRDLPEEIPCRLIERLGKHHTGRELDGRTHHQFPDHRELAA